jgi:hypothetical protein
VVGALVFAAPAAAQGVRVSGRIVSLVARDSVPVAGVWAVLHQLTRDREGPVDSAQAGRDGRYAMTGPADTLATYLVSVRYRGIAYFAPAFAVRERRIEVDPIVVFDTSSVAPNVVLAERHAVIRAPEPAGSRRVIELLVLRNSGDRTRIAGPDRPVWHGRLPPQAVAFELGPSDFSEEAVAFADGEVTVTGPVPPGERQVLVSYQLPPNARVVDLSPGDSGTQLTVMLEEDAATVTGGGLVLTGLEDLNGVSFRRFAADSATGGTAEVRFPAPSGARTALVVTLVVALSGLALGGTLGWWWKRRAPSDPEALTPSGDPAETLAQRIAALDREFAGRENEDYRRARDALKAQLVEAVAARRATH